MGKVMVNITVQWSFPELIISKPQIFSADNVKGEVTIFFKVSKEML